MYYTVLVVIARELVKVIAFPPSPGAQQYPGGVGARDECCRIEAIAV